MQDSGSRPGRNTIMNLISDPTNYETFTNSKHSASEEVAQQGEHAFKFSPRCKICTGGEVRLQDGTYVDIKKHVNKLLIQGRAYQEIIDEVRSIDPDTGIKYNTVKVHSMKHVSWNHVAIRRVLEDRARDTNKDFIEGTQHLIDLSAYAEVMMLIGFNAMVSGEEGTVNPREGLHAAKVLHEVKKEETAQMDGAMALSQLNQIINAIREVVPPEMFQRIAQQIGNNTQQIENSSDTYEDIDYTAEDDDEELDIQVDHDDRDTLEN
jgi:hypothetical protein